MKKKALKGNGLKACESCSYWYDDGFCMQHCYYTEGAYYCPKWTDKAIDFDYNRVYRLCQQYIDICHMFEEHEKLKEKNPDLSSNKDFILDYDCVKVPRTICNIDDILDNVSAMNEIIFDRFENDITDKLKKIMSSE